jgi:alkylation response protein AidB-like acyl-CoA dehydrogenase
MARLTEGHVDALRILDEAGTKPVPGAAYGVWASRSRASGLAARRRGDRWVLDGTLRFASGAGVVDHALVPAWLAHDIHVLLDLEVRDWAFDTDAWRTRAMEQSRSHQVTLTEFATEATEIGGPGFYLGRRGFFPGGVGVAAVWAGGAARIGDLLADVVPAPRRTPMMVARFGRLRTQLATAAAIVRETAPRLADTRAEDLRAVATLARAGVAHAVRGVLDEARTLAGPAGLAFDEDLTRAVDDLAMFVAQQNEDGDAQWLGGL